MSTTGALAALLALSACGRDVCGDVLVAPPPAVEDELTALDGLDFDAFVDAAFRALLRRDPELASELGLSATVGLGDSQLTDISAAAEADGARLNAGLLARLRTFDRGALSREQRRTFDVVAWYFADAERQHAFTDLDYPITQMVGSPQSALLLFLSDLHPLASVANAQDFVNRVCQAGTKIDQLIAAIDRAAAAGVIPPRVVLERSLRRVEATADATARELPVYQSFVARLAAVPDLSDARRERLAERAAGALEEALIPAYARLQDRLERLSRAAPVAVGIGQLAHGEAFYAATLAHFTTTTLTAAEISALGQQELDRIHAEMRLRLNALGYPSDETLAESFARLAAEGGVVSGAAIATTYEDIIRAATARLGEAFATVPQTPCIVIPIAGGGFYVGPPLDGSRPGAFYAPTGGAVARAGMPTLAYHETVPGHHLQIALLMESDLPLARKLIQPTGYVEGWALYAERLARDLGWYADDPYGNLGRLQAEAFRAARMVVDTGIHHEGWSVGQAEQFMVDNIGVPTGTIDIAGEVARYVAWPGQATAYMTGMLELLALRDGATQQLGERFALPAFHDAVLQAGPMPFAVLAGAVQDYVDEVP